MESRKWKGNKRVPELRFPGFEGGWEKRRFRDVCDIRSGKGFKANEYVEEGVPLIRIDNISYGFMDRTNLVYLPEYYLKEYPELNIRKGEILLALNRPITNNKLKILFVKEEYLPAILYQRVGKITIKKDYEPYCVYVALTNVIFKFVILSSVGSDQPFISTEELKKEILRIPSLLEQQKIGNFFYKIDKKLELQQQRIEALKEYKKGMMQKIFSQEIRFKDDNGKDYPEWEEKRFSSFLSVPKKVKVENPKIDNIITVRLHRRGIYSGVQRENLSLGSTNYFYREEGQFIYGKQNIFNGAFGILPKEFDGHYSSADIPALDINEKHIRAEFFDSYLSQISVYKRLENKAIGTGSKRLHESVLLKEEMLVPSLPEQTKIANFLSSLDKKIELEEEKLENFKQFKKGLMQKMFI